jgi:hypothetical protein
VAMVTGGAQPYNYVHSYIWHCSSDNASCWRFVCFGPIEK